MTIPIYDHPTDKLPEPASIHDAPTKKVLSAPKNRVELVARGTHDEERLLQTIRLDLEYEQRFTWIPFAIFVGAILFWMAVGWIISENYYAILWWLTVR